MAKYTYNESVLLNELIPKIDETMECINEAADYASSITYPDGNFNFATISSNIRDGSHSMNIYKNSVNSIHAKMSGVFSFYTSNIINIVIEKIKNKNSIVK